MINDGYLIPANTKKGELIFGIFTPSGLIFFGSGLAITLILLLVVGADETLKAILCLLPALISGFLVAIPIANYRNVYIFLKSMLDFYNKDQQVFKWKGWCYNAQSKK